MIVKVHQVNNDHAKPSKHKNVKAISMHECNKYTIRNIICNDLCIYVQIFANVTEYVCYAHNYVCLCTYSTSKKGNASYCSVAVVQRSFCVLRL